MMVNLLLRLMWSSRLICLRARSCPFLMTCSTCGRILKSRRWTTHWVQFRLPEPFSPFLDYLTFGILPVHILGELTPDELIDAPFNLSPVGSGAYRFNRMIVEDGEIAGVELLAFEDHHGGRPFIDELTFRYYPDDVAGLEAYRAGDIQGIGRITPEAFGKLPWMLI